jgi:hypothetical protein
MVPFGLSESGAASATNPVLRCFDNPKGLNCGGLLVGIVPESASGLRLGTAVLS